MTPRSLGSSGPVVLSLIGVSGLATALLLPTRDGVPAMTTLLVLGGTVFATLSLIRDRQLRVHLCAMFSAGLVLRAVTAVVVYRWNPVFFSLDQVGYFGSGAELAARWRAAGNWASFAWLIGGPGNHFSEMWADLSYFVGPSELALRMATCVVGAYGSVRICRLGAETFGIRQGRWAGWVAALWPSLIIWAAQGLREPLIILLWCEAGLGVVRVCQGRGWRGLLGLAVGIYGLSLLRPHAAVWAGIGACMALVVASARRGAGVRLLAAGVASMVLLAAGLGFLGSGLLTGSSLAGAAEVREGFQGGGSSFGATANISNLAGALLYLPVGLAYFLLAPFPWQAGSALQLSSMIEQPVWYLLFALGVYGVLASVRRRGAEALIPLAFIVPIALFCGLVISNVGTGYRDRAQLVPFVFIYVAEALLTRRPQRVARAIPLAVSRRRRQLQASP